MEGPGWVPVHDPPGSNGNLLASLQAVDQTTTLPGTSKVGRKALARLFVQVFSYTLIAGVVRCPCSIDELSRKR